MLQYLKGINFRERNFLPIKGFEKAVTPLCSVFKLEIKLPITLF